MFIIGGFDAGVNFCSIEAYENSEIIMVGEDRLYDTEKEEFIPVKCDSLFNFEEYNGEYVDLGDGFYIENGILCDEDDYIVF